MSAIPSSAIPPSAVSPSAVPSSAVLRAVSPGMLTTVQDLGRPGHQAEGVPVSGAMDRFALEIGNILLGNERGAAALEIALRGPTLRVLRDLSLCVCGADLGATLAGAAVPLWKAVRARQGDEISFTAQQRGVWAYLCVQGGIDVPMVLGSRSTYLRAGLGGMEGRALKIGDVVRAFSSSVGSPDLTLPPGMTPALGSRVEVRAVPGPQDSLFDSESIERFFKEEFTVAAQSDRMGYRLQGPPLRLAGGADILSDGTALGSVQVPAGGQPIVLMADRQTTGGYAKIATVISVDVPRIAQLAPGGTVSFHRVTIEQAQDAAVRHGELLDALAGKARS